MRRALRFPVRTLSHLTQDPSGGELEALVAAEEAGLDMGLFALPAAVEDSFYRFNNLPGRLAALYRGLDPLDPDEDLLEEAEPQAQRLLDEAFLLDEVIDAIYQSLAELPAELQLRRADEPPGTTLRGPRSALLAIKRLFRDDWQVASVAQRLTSGFSVALEARPVLIHAPAVSRADAQQRAPLAATLGQGAVVWLDAADAVVRIA